MLNLTSNILLVTANVYGDKKTEISRMDKNTLPNTLLKEIHFK